MRFTAAERGVSVAPASRNTASIALRASPLNREGSRLEAVIVSLAGDASSQKPVPKKIPMIAAATSPTETGKSRMPAVRAAGLVGAATRRRDLGHYGRFSPMVCE